MNENPDNFELLEAPSPEALVPDPWLEPWMIVVAAVVVIALLAIVIFRKKPPPAEVRIEARNEAYAEAKSALDKVDAANTRDAAVRCSLILRKYLSVATGDPALFETHQEYISRHESLKGYTAEARSAAGNSFTKLASMKYAAEMPSVAAADVLAESRGLLETLHGGFQS
jgi:hypothetical protein